MIVYGRNPVRELLRGRRARTVRELWASEQLLREPWVAAAKQVGLEVSLRAAREIAHRCGSEDHQGVCAAAGPFPYAGARELLERPEPLLVVLDQVQDPHNLGAICRTAECAGVTGVVIPERRAAEVSAAVCKASAGAVEHMRIARVRNIADFLAEARRAGCWCYGASPAAAPGGAGASAAPAASAHAEARSGAAGRGPVAYDAPDYRGAVALVLGGEGRGLRPRVAGACDELIALPLRGRIASLGVGAAAAAILYEILQRREEGVDKNP